MFFTTVALMALALASVSARDCTELTASAASEFASSFDVTKLSAGGNAFCLPAPQTGRVVLAPIANVFALVAQDPARLQATFYRSDSDKNGIELECDFSKDVLASLVGSIGGAAAPNLSAIKFTCRKAGSEATLFEWTGTKAVLHDEALSGNGGGNDNGGDNDVSSESMDSNTDKVHLIDLKTDEDCLNVQSVLKAPLQLISGGCLRVPSFGRFELSDFDLGEVANELQNGGALKVRGRYVRKNGDKIQVTCTVSEDTIKLIVPFALSGGKGTLDVDALRDALDIECADKDNKYRIGVDGNGISGIDELGDVLDAAGVKLNVKSVEYAIKNGKRIEVGGFSFENGVLTTPNGESVEVDADDVIKFLGDSAVVTSKDGKHIKVETPLGSVSIDARGRLIVRVNNKKLSVAELCESVKQLGSQLNAVCDGVRQTVSADGTVVKDDEGTVRDASGRKEKVIGTFSKGKACLADDECREKLLAAANDESPDGCRVVAGQNKFFFTCDDEKSDEDAANAFDKLVAEVEAEPIDEPDSLLGSASSAAAAVAASIVALFSGTAAATLFL